MTIGSHGISLLSIGLIGILPLTACQQSETDEVKIPPSPPPVQTITPISDTATLESYLKAGIRAHTTNYNVIQTGDGPTSLPITLAGDNTSASFSSTNIQETGVDEADRIKTDGQWLYLLSHQVDCCITTTPLLRIMHLTSAPWASAGEQARLSLGTDVGGDGLYLFSANGGTALNRLAIVGNTRPAPLGWYSPWRWQDGGVDVTIIDVTDPTQPSTGTQLHLDGHLVSSRRIGDTLYLVSRYVPAVPGYEVYPASDEERH